LIVGNLLNIKDLNYKLLIKSSFIFFNNGLFFSEIVIPYIIEHRVYTNSCIESCNTKTRKDRMK